MRPIKKPQSRDALRLSCGIHRIWRRERDSNPRAVSSKLISSNWEGVPYRPDSYLKYADFQGFLRDCMQFMRNLRENCGMVARWMGDGDRKSALTFA